VADSNSSSQNTQILSAFASILGVLGIFLYFIGWIYRWAYFGWFHLELNRLDLPLRSFLFVPIQVFCGSPSAFVRTLIAIILGAICIKFTLWLVQPSPTKPTLWSVQGIAEKKHSFRSNFHQLLAIPRFFTDIIPPSLRKDLTVVIWLLLILFWLARIQGTTDARRDAVNETSTLPVITLVLPEKQIALGQNLDRDNPFNPSLKGYRIIGDQGLFYYLRGKENNDSGTKPPRVWRLLLENNKWTYVFPTLSAKPENSKWTYVFSALFATSKDDERPPLLAINQDKEGQLMILASDYTRSK
jgi:hypothetical protein